MIVQFNGFNTTKRKIGSFSFHLNDQTLNNLHFTFNQIYLTANKFQKPWIFNFKTNEFNELVQPSESIYIVSTCTDTINFWCLFSTKNYPKLVQYRDEVLSKTFNLPELKLNLENVFIISTDINLYLLEVGNDKEVKCRFDLNKTQLHDFSKYKKQEVQLNESSSSQMPLDKVLLKGGIQQISSGKEHVLILTDTKQVYSFGIGTKGKLNKLALGLTKFIPKVKLFYLQGQLGHGEIENCYEPKLISKLKDIEIIQISTGSLGWHSGAIDKEGNCYVWGWNSNGQLGLETDHVFVTTPTRLVVYQSHFTDVEVRFKEISLGARHTVMLSMEGGVYTCGWNKYEQLVHERLVESECEDVCDIEEATRVTQLDKIVEHVKCGSWFTTLGF